MTQTIKARVIKTDDGIFAEINPYIWNDGNYLNTCFVCKVYFNNGAKLQRVCKSCCEKEVQLTPAHPNHLKYFQDNVGNVVEIELKEVITGLSMVEPHMTETYAVPKVDEWEEANNKAGWYASMKCDLYLQPVEWTVAYTDYLKQHYSITHINP